MFLSCILLTYSPGSKLRKVKRLAQDHTAYTHWIWIQIQPVWLHCLPCGLSKWTWCVPTRVWVLAWSSPYLCRPRSVASTTLRKSSSCSFPTVRMWMQRTTSCGRPCTPRPPAATSTWWKSSFSSTCASLPQEQPPLCLCFFSKFFFCVSFISFLSLYFSLCPFLCVSVPVIFSFSLHPLFISAFLSLFLPLSSFFPKRPSSFSTSMCLSLFFFPSLSLLHSGLTPSFPLYVSFSISLSLHSLSSPQILLW